MAIPPLICILGVISTFILSFTFFSFFPELFNHYFFLTVYVLIGFYTLYVLFTDREVYEKRRWFSSPGKILGKYLFWGTFFYLACLLYENHGFYLAAFPKSLMFFQFSLKGYLWIGLPYFILAEKCRSSLSNRRSDPYVHFISFVRRVRNRDWISIKKRIFRGVSRRFLLSSLVRFHYIPVMVEQMYSTHEKALGGITDPYNVLGFTLLTSLMTSLFWSMDANNAAVGYFWESNFTKTHFKEIDPYPFHWLVTLICYYPFMSWSTTFLPSPFTNDGTDLLLSSEWFTYFTEGMSLFLLACYALNNCTLSFACSNLSYKVIQTGGLYRFVRHPATLLKLGFFSIIIFKYKASFNPVTITAYIIWMGVYVLRAVCEERFLRKHADYREYMTQVRYRLIPGLF